MLGWKLEMGMLVGGLVVLIYTFLGGMWSVSLTDTVQFILMTVGIFFVMLPIGWGAVGGWQTLSGQLPVSHLRLDTIGYETIFSYFLLFFLGLIIGQDIWQRVFTAKDARVARRGTVIAGVYCVAYAVAMALVGMIAAVEFPGLEDPQMAFATTAVDLLPPGASGMVLAGSLSALMSTASGPLLASSTLIANDLYRRFFAKEIADREFLKRTRWITGVVGVAVVCCALWIQDVIKALDIAYTLLSGSLFVPVFAGLFWKRANTAGTLASMCLSAGVAITGMSVWGIDSTLPIILGLGTSLITLVVVSLVTTPPDRERLVHWEQRLAGTNDGSDP
jgi:SSS family solute:Na+ symporter